MSKNKVKSLENVATEELKELTQQAIKEATEETQKSENNATEETQKSDSEETQKRVEISAKELAEFTAVMKTFKIKEESFHVAYDKVTDLRNAKGEGADDSVRIGQYGYGSNGKGELLSVWWRRKATNRSATMINGKKEKHAFPSDLGLRFSVADYEMFNNVAECKELISALNTEHTEIKHNEPRYSFKALSELTAFVASLYNAYEKSVATKEATKEAIATKEA